MTATDMPAIMTARQAAAMSGVNERTVRRWLSSGELEAGKVGRDFQISGETFAAFLRARRGATADSGQTAASAAALPAEQHSTAGTPIADSAALIRMADLVEKLTQQNLELAGRVGYYQAETEQLRATLSALQAPATTERDAVELDTVATQPERGQLADQAEQIEQLSAELEQVRAALATLQTVPTVPASEETPVAVAPSESRPRTPWWRLLWSWAAP